MNDLECLENFMLNIEIERNRLGLTQKQMADKIGMSPSSYKRMLRGEMNLKASLVIRDLYLLTGKCCHEFMGLEDDRLRVSAKVRRLDDTQLKVIEVITDLLLNENGTR